MWRVLCMVLGVSVLGACDRTEPSARQPAPDNTGVNERDRDGTAALPTDQGGSQADVDLTQRVRQGIIDLDDLSMNGRNIKVISLNGTVTLRGPVNSTAERDRIVEVARRVAGPDRVVDQLEVKNQAETAAPVSPGSTP